MVVGSGGNDSSCSFRGGAPQWRLLCGVGRGQLGLGLGLGLGGRRMRPRAAG